MNDNQFPIADQFPELENAQIGGNGIAGELSEDENPLLVPDDYLDGDYYPDFKGDNVDDLFFK